MAEGSARITSKDKAHFITTSYSSAIETVNHLIRAFDLEFITEEEYVYFRLKLDEIANKLNALRNSILKTAVRN
ncbi:four helix bundle protein [Nubsella zeaxanthinifaciens]|uniref:four helix bundle protein n=1 Tax=Nubsella zeaxanthinifaciens TaxID=392412 RepID=UPI003520D42E